MNGYGAVGDARKRMHPGDAAQHRANLEFSARKRAEARVEELEDKVARLSFPPVVGRCPTCGSSSLFLGAGGYVTCGWLECTRPDHATDLLAEGAE